MSVLGSNTKMKTTIYDDERCYSRTSAAETKGWVTAAAGILIAVSCSNDSAKYASVAFTADSAKF